MNCPYCKGEMNDKANFCGKCGHRMARCPSCNLLFTYKQKICPIDGMILPKELMIDLPEAEADLDDKTAPILWSDIPSKDITTNTHPKIVPPSAKPKKYCKECGVVCSEGQLLCENCKKKHQPIPKKKNRFVIPAIIALIICLCIAIAFGIKWLMDSHQLDSGQIKEPELTDQAPVEQQGEIESDNHTIFVESSKNDSELTDGTEKKETDEEKSDSSFSEKNTDVLATAKRYAGESAVEYQNHAYAIFNYKDEQLKDFYDCEHFCEGMGGHLAVINTQDENDFLYGYVIDSNLHLAFFGFTDQDEEGEWSWVSNYDSSYTNWYQESGKVQPNNGANNSGGGDENYAEFFKAAANGTWNDAPFGANTYHFICEWE